MGGLSAKGKLRVMGKTLARGGGRRNARVSLEEMVKKNPICDEENGKGIDDSFLVGLAK